MDFQNPRGTLLLTKKTSQYIATTGLALTAFALLLSILLGFGGFSIEAFSAYEIAGHISRLQLNFLILTGVGLMLSGVAYVNQAKRQREENPHFMLLLFLAAGIVFFALAIFGLTSQLRGTNFWGETTFEEIQDTLFFNNLTLASFLVLGTMQVILWIMFLKTKMLQKHQLSKAAKIITATSGFLLVMKGIIDYPPIKEATFIFSYTLKIPFPNNILSLAAPLIFLSGQILLTIIFSQNQKPLD